MQLKLQRKHLNQISGKKPSERNAKETQRDWGIRKGEPIGVSVTVRGEDAISITKKIIGSKRRYC